MSTNPHQPTAAVDDTSTSSLQETRSPITSSELIRQQEEDRRKKQLLILEKQLQQIGGQLIDIYKSNSQWIQVEEIVHTLNTNSNRISIINTLMDDTVTVTSTPETKEWVINTVHHSVSRSLDDIIKLKSHLYTNYASLSPTDTNTDTANTETDTVRDSLQQLLSLALGDDLVKHDHILASFLTNKIEDVSHNTDKPTTTNGPTESTTTPSTNNDTVPSTNNDTVPSTNNDTNTTSNDTVPSTPSGEGEGVPTVTQQQEGDVPTITQQQEGDVPIITRQQEEDVPTISRQDIKEDKVNGSSSGMSIGEYDSSPHVPKRQTSLPHTDPVPSSPPPPPPPHTQSPFVSKRETSSEEGSSVNIGTSESDAVGKLSAKGRSQSVFYDGEGGAKSINKKKSLSKSLKKSTKVKEQDDTSKVKLATPQLAVEWDPTCLLEELYNDCQPGVGHSQTGENSRHTGYLGKLPVNQRKPSVMKGWKHRFFRLTRGSLFYYDAENSAKATSFIRLSDSKIVQHPDSLKIEIIEKGGNFIMLRAESREDMYAWGRTLQLESVHPTMTHRLSLSPGRSECVIIVDLGSCSIRAGISNDNTYPQMFFPTICAVNEDKVVACGNEALLPSVRTSSKLVYPCRRRLRLDSTLPIRECFQSIFEKICKSFRVEPSNSSLLVCISPVMAETEQVTLCEVLLEILNFKSILIQEQTTMALYSYNHTSGIVVNIGDSIDVVPIIDGFKVNAGTSHSPFGGHSITESLSKLATSHGIRYFSEAEMYIVRFIKESICFLSQDYPTDSIQCEETPTEYKRGVDVDRFQLSDHRKLIHLDSALFTASEGLFNPGIWGKDNTGLHEMVQKAIEQCPIDMRRQIVKHIYLAGGTTLLIGLQERLQKELEVIYPRLEIQVHGSDNRHHAAFLGAGVLTSLNSFTKSLVDIDTWSSKGLEAMKHNQT